MRRSSCHGQNNHRRKDDRRHPQPGFLATSVDPVRGPNPTNPKAALRRCRAAWQRAFDAYMATKKRPDSTDKVFAAMDANEAYRNAMPMLAGPNGVRDFIACTAHGILIGAIKPAIAGQLLYAAQIAMNSLSHEPTKQPKARKERENHAIASPSPAPKGLPAGSDFPTNQMQ